MAVDIQAHKGYRNRLISLTSSSFRRKRGHIKTKKIHRKIRLRTHHVILSFLLLSGIFFGFQRAYLFLITWEKLDVRKVEILCSREDIRADIQRLLGNQRLGNILLLDIARLQEKITSHRWIKDVHIRKIFPSTVRIEIVQRVPAARIRMGQTYLIDRDGVLLESVGPQDFENLPLFVDADNFKTRAEEKRDLAWRCLDSLDEAQKAGIAAMDVSDYENVCLRYRHSKTLLKLGKDRFSEKIRLYLRNQALLEKYGPLEYVDLRYADRIILRPLLAGKRQGLKDSGKEAF
ncbi:MAG: cell division protein FtsQ/DivIB [Candidatus Aminicenantales bacterium]